MNCVANVEKICISNNVRLSKIGTNINAITSLLCCSVNTMHTVDLNGVYELVQTTTEFV